MSDEAVDKSRRRFLTATTSVVGAVGVGFVAVPFLSSMSPSARAEAAGAPAEVDISKLKPGEMITVEWRKKPIWIVHRTEKQLENLDEVEEFLSDPKSLRSEQPEYAQNEARARQPEYLVMEGICTHLGCSPQYRPEVGIEAYGGEEQWKGGFFCPCHGSRFDMSGRVYAGSPAPTNMTVPPYMFLSDSVILVGEDKGAA